MKKILFILFLSMIIKGYCQISGTGNSFDVPQLYPVSPTAASLYTHSKIPMNLSAGQANLQIPLYTIEQSDYTLPIYLRYNNGGLILDQGPSTSGLGWTLAASGVINREVRGLPDESPKGYYGINSIRQNVLQPYFSTGQISATHLGGIANGLFDSEPDVYHVSVGDVSFSFKVGENNEVFLLTKHNYKVSFSLDEIVVTDTKGNQFIFDTKETSSTLGEFDDTDGTFQNGNIYTSSWYLSKIKLYNNSEIRFLYAGRDEVVNYSFMGTSFINLEQIQGSCQNSNYGGSQTYTKTFVNEKILSGIIFDFGSITLTRKDQDFYKLYDEILIKNKQNKDIIKYDLNYDTANKRALLSQIDRNGERYYSFDYYNKSQIPDFVTNSSDIPTAMDWWGYYNGKHGNTAITGVPGRPGIDKSSSLRYTMAGALKSVVYPTKGTSSFFYEPHEILRKDDANNTGTNSIPPFNRQLKLTMNGDPSKSKEETFSYTFTEDTYAQISHNVKTYSGCYVLLHMDAPSSADGLSGNYVDKFAELKLRKELHGRPITDTPIYPAYFTEDIGDGSDNASDLTWFRGNTTETIKIKAGTYNFRLKTYGVSPYGNSSIKLEIKFHKSTPNENVDHQERVTIGGLRVYKIENCSGPDADCTEQFYRYSDAKTFDQGNYFYDTKVRKWCGEFGNTFTVYDINRRIFNYRSFTNVNFNGGVPVYYGKVTEANGQTLVKETVNNNYDYINDFTPHKNDDGSFIITLPNGTVPKPTSTVYHRHNKNGLEVSTFEDPIFDSESTYPFIPKVKDVSMGRLKKMEVFKYDTANQSPKAAYDILQETEYDYGQFRSNLTPDGITTTNGYPLGLKVARKINFDGGNQTISDNEIQQYFHFIKYGEVYNLFLPTEVKDIEHIGSKKITSERTTYYNASLLPSSVEVSKSDGGMIKEEFTYVDELEQPNGAQTILVDKNNIATPISVKTFSKQINTAYTLLNHQHSKFKDWGNDLVLPQFIQNAKNSDALENRLVYHKYDTHGNPLEISQANGIRIIYVWGYQHTYPIAKIENASYGSLTTAQQNAINSAKSAADNDTNAANENTLRSRLKDLRNQFPDAMVSTYTYDPIVGVTSMTDSKEYTMYYQYDDFNRLRFVKDADQNIISENKYNYTN